MTMRQTHSLRAKRGFSLIELAIVMAVIGVVVGGIYVAASSMNESRKLTQTQTQMQQIVANTRRAFTSRSQFNTALPAASAYIDGPAYAMEKAMNLMPGDMVDNGTYFENAFGGRTLVYSSGNPQQFGLSIDGLRTAQCAQLMVRTFPTAAAIRQLGLLGVGNGGAAAIDMTDGVQPSEAALFCSRDATGKTNRMNMVFTLRGN